MLDPLNNFIESEKCKVSNLEREQVIYAAFDNLPDLLEAFKSACSRVAYHENKIKFKEEQQILNNLDYFFVASIFIVCCVISILAWGINNLCVNIFYYLSCHCLLKIIIEWRNGNSIPMQIQKGIDNRMQNDEELAEVIGDQINELRPSELGDVS